MLLSDAMKQFPAQRDERGFIFIDRNGRVFEVILDYLRTNRVLLNTGITREQLDVELDFYGIVIGERTIARLH
jgi:hypothetical protein